MKSHPLQTTALTVVLALSLLGTRHSRAGTITWTSLVAGNWSTGANWDLNRVPNSADDVLLNNGGTIEQIAATSGANMATLTLDGPSVANVLNYGGSTPFIQNMYGGTSKPLLRITSNASSPVSVTKVNFRIRVNGELEIASGKTLTLANSYISENSAGLKLTKTGAGTLAFSGSGTPKASFTGGLDMQEGTWIASQNSSSLPPTGLVNFTNAEGTAAKITMGTSASVEALGGGNADSLIDGSNTLTITGSQSTTYAGLIGGSVKITHSGGGTLVLPSANTYTGVTTISGGTLSTGLLANGGTASGIGQASTSTANLVIDGGTLKYTGAAASINRGFTIGLNGAAIDRSTGSGQLDFNSSIALSGSGARILTVTTGSGSVRLRGGIGDNGGATTIVKQGSGQLLLSGSNTYTGQLQILQGFVQLGNAGPGGESSGVGHSVAVSSGAELRIRHATADTVTFNADISGAGTVQMNYGNGSPGGGSLTLGGNNSFTGDMTINPTGGTEILTLKAGSATALGSGNVVFGPYGKLDLNGINVTAGLLRGLSGAPNGIVTNDGPADATLTLNSSQTQTYDGVIQDGVKKVSIAKDGSGTQTLAGANTYSGDTTVTAGTLELAQINPSNESSTVSIASTAVLHLSFDGTDTVDKLFINGVQQPATVYHVGNSGGRITGSGTLTVSSGPPSAGFTAWIATFPAIGVLNQPGDDPDDDGIENLLEFVLNGNPTLPDASKLPVLNVTDTHFEFTYSRRDDSVSPETIQTFQFSNTLEFSNDIIVPPSSGTVGVATIDIVDGSPADTVKISIPKSEAGTTGRLFGRLQIVNP